MQATTTSVSSRICHCFLDGFWVQGFKKVELSLVFEWFLGRKMRLCGFHFVSGFYKMTESDMASVMAWGMAWGMARNGRQSCV